MGTCVNCKYAGRPTYKSPCSECHGYNKHEAVEIRTNGDRIRAMSDEELAKFLNDLANRGEGPWSGPYARQFCDNCPAVKVKIADSDEEIEAMPCEFEGHICPHGDEVVWWLKEPVEEVKE